MAEPSEPPLGSLAARATVTHRGASTVTAAGTRVVPGKGERVLLEKGFSQMDWMRLTKSGADLAGLGGGPQRRLTLEEVATHSSEADCWTVIGDRVYNLTPYLPFHPGGKPLLMKGAGRDSTALFNKYHPWVNVHYMLASCLVGVIEGGDAPLAGKAEEEEEEDE